MIIAIVGATGLVGRSFMQVLEEKKLPDCEYRLMASERSAGQKINFMGKEHIVEELTEHSFDQHVDIALFSAGGSTSKKFAPIAAKNGCIVIDNSSQWRMDENVPLIVPEVNPHHISKHKGIIANPNCSTIQAVVALNPLHKKYGIKRIVYSTYQAVSGAGVDGISDLERTLKGESPQKFPHSIAKSCLPHIDSFLDNGYTKEEMKMINETHKILGDDTIRITATTVRVPIHTGHSESINVELKKPFKLDGVVRLLEKSDGIVVVDKPLENQYPLAENCVGRDEVFVGRIRRDFSLENGLNLWVVADNVRKGAATNAVQIAELILGGRR